MWTYNYTDELYHYGVKGMRWGVRKDRKWASAKHQPSSARSSALAGIYAATGNKTVGKALEKSNAKDAERWERAKANLAAEKQRSAGQKQYKATRTDIAMYGKRGAERIANRRTKGDSRQKALVKELGTQLAIGTGVTVAGAVGVYLLTSGKASKAVDRLKDAGKNTVDSYLNASVLDSGGNVIARYHSPVKVGKQIVEGLIKL